MALQFVGGNTATKAGATSGNSTISLTTLTGGISSSATIGDLVIAVYATGSTADRALTITDGTTNYTTIGAELYANGTSYDTNLEVAYKRLTAADTSVTFGPTGNAADAGAMAVYVWRGVDQTTPLDVTPTTATGTATGRQNPAAITPTTAGSVIVIAGGASAATGAVFTASYLTAFRSATSADTQDAMVGIGYLTWTSGAYDGAQWTGGTTNAADSWAAVTFALRPAPAAQTLTSSLYINSNTFYTPTLALSPAPQTLTPSLYTNTNVFYSTAVTSSITLDASLYTNNNEFYTPIVTPGTATLTPNIYTNTNVFYSPIASQTSADQSVNVNLFENTNVFYTHQLDTIIFSEVFNNSQVFYEQSLTSEYSINANIYDNSNTFYAATISASNAVQNLSVSLYSNINTFYEPTVEFELHAPQGIYGFLFNNINQFFPSIITRQIDENMLQGYFENRQKSKTKAEEAKPEQVVDYDEELAILLLMA